MNSRAIKIKSRELELPFSHLLAGYVLESIVSMVGESPWKKHLWLCNREVLGLEQYRRGCDRRLIYMYEKDKEHPGRGILSYFQEKGEAFGLRLEGVVTERGLSLDVYLEEMYVPVELEISPSREEHIFPREESLRLFMENNKTVTYYHYPYEQVVAGHLFEIMKHLELINDMSHYLEVYELSGQIPLEGRRIKDSLESMCRENGISGYDVRYQTWKEYETYAYMKKKWKALLRQKKRDAPSWEEVMKRLLIFLPPIWKALEEDRVFFGDWMPELQRYLD